MLLSRHGMSTEKPRTRARAEHRPRALRNFDFRASYISKQRSARQCRPKVFDGIDNPANVGGKNHHIAADARACMMLHACIDRAHLLSFNQHARFVGTYDADTLVAQTQAEGTADQSSSNDRDLFDHLELAEFRSAAGSAPGSFGCGGAMRLAVTKIGSMSVGICVSRSSARCTSGRITASVSSIFFAPA